MTVMYADNVIAALDNKPLNTLFEGLETVLKIRLREVALLKV